jgi:hypothetical protein
VGEAAAAGLGERPSDELGHGPAPKGVRLPCASEAVVIGDGEARIGGGLTVVEF